MDFSTIPWYQSTQGPKISQTIFNVVGSFLPVFDLLLMHFGVSIPGLSETIQALIACAAFLWFAVRAAIGYVRAKIALQAQISVLQRRLATSSRS